MLELAVVEVLEINGTEVAVFIIALVGDVSIGGVVTGNELTEAVLEEPAVVKLPPVAVAVKICPDVGRKVCEVDVDDVTVAEADPRVVI